MSLRSATTVVIAVAVAMVMVLASSSSSMSFVDGFVPIVGVPLSISGSTRPLQLLFASSTTASSSSSSSSSKSSSSTSSSSSSLAKFPYKVEVVTGGDPSKPSSSRTTTTTSNSNNDEIRRQYQRVIDIATYRNSLTSPDMMVSKAQTKRDSIDPVQSALDGIKIGLVYVGPVIAGLTYFGGGTGAGAGTGSDVDADLISKTITNYVVLGGGLASALGINNYMGKSVHVPTVDEATNRIIVDLSEGVLRQQDVGFVAVCDDEETERLITDGEEELDKKEIRKLKRLVNKFQPSNGVCGTVDVQLRNSDQSPNGVRTIDNVELPASISDNGKKELLGPHLHIKNMDVHKSLRRQGIATSLLQEIEKYATANTDAMALTL